MPDIITRKEAAGMSSKTLITTFAISAVITVILMCLTMGFTFYNVSKADGPGAGQYLPFDHFQYKYNCIKLYHWLFLLAFLATLIIAAVGIMLEEAIILAFYAMVLLITEAIRFILFLVSNTVYRDTSYEEEKVTLFWLAYDAAGLEIVTQLFYVVTLLATAAIVVKFWSRSNKSVLPE